MNGVVARQGGDALDVRAGQHEHVAVERSHERQHDKEHGDQTHDDRRVVVVDYEDDATARTEGPDASDDEGGPSHRHDVVVSQGVENRDVAVDGYS